MFVFGQLGRTLTIRVKVMYPCEQNVSDNRKIKYSVKACEPTVDRRRIVWKYGCTRE